jgi:integrase
MSVRRRRGKKWMYDFTIKGVRYRGIIEDARTQADAKAGEARERENIASGKPARAVGSGAFINYAEDVFLGWSKENKRSWTDDIYHVRTFKAYFGDKSFNDITPMLIEKFKRDRRNTPTKAGNPRALASVNREIQLLSKIFNQAITDGAAAVNPCASVKKYREDNARTRYVTEEEESRLVAALTGQRSHLRPIVLLAIHTGMRRGELLSRHWSHVDFNLGVIRVTNTKSGADRTVPMNQMVRTELVNLAEANGRVGPVFPSMKRKAALVEIKKAFAAARAEAGLSDVHFHDLRHTFGTRLAEKGASAFDIAELMGHSDLRMTKRYTHATSQSLRRAVDSLAENIPGTNLSPTYPEALAVNGGK